MVSLPRCFQGRRRRLLEGASDPIKDLDRGAPRVNLRITASNVRLIDADGSQIGVRSLSEAIALARSRGVDLVEIAPLANPPVCKLLDFAKFRYSQEKKAREARKKQKAGFLKEVRFRPGIGAHDLETKMKHMEEFLQEHDKVRITVVFRGREVEHKDIGFKLLTAVRERLAAFSIVEQAPSMDRNRLSMTLVPKHA